MKKKIETSAELGNRQRETKADRISRELECLARELGPGERLPSVRSLCDSLEISLATLNTAMRSLEVRGVIDRRHGSGVYVTESISTKRIAVVVNSGFLLAGGSPVWGMLMGELMARLPAGDAEGAIFIAIPPKQGGLPAELPTDLLYAIDQGRVDGVVAVGMSEVAILPFEKSGIPVVSFSGSGHWMFRINVAGMAGDLAQQFVKEGKKTAVVAGCTSRAQWELARDAVEQAGLNVVGGDNSHWVDGDLVERMSQPFFHCGQDFAVQFEKVVTGAEKPDVLFLMDDMFAHGFLMVWRNSIHRDLVELACHSNRELRMFMGWEGQMGLMEIEVFVLAQILVDAIMLLVSDRVLNTADLTKSLALRHPTLPMETHIEEKKNVTTLLWQPQLLG